MRIVQLIPGTCEAFYCENCLRDFDLLEALGRIGHDARIVPLYLPLTADNSAFKDEAPIFFGGINVYLQQKSSFFRRTPRWLDRLFDARWLLQWASRKAGMTSPSDLGESTVSMLRGQHGCQAKELDRLIEYLSEEARPDVVVLSNALLVGLARPIRARLGVPVVCLLQDEDAFLDALPAPYGAEAWQAVAAGAAGVDLFISVSRYYRGVMVARLGLKPERVAVAYAGIDPAGYLPAAAPPDPPVIGFLSPALAGKGLGLLVEAFMALKKTEGLARLKLRVAGGETVGSHPFLEDLQGRIAAWGVADDLEFLPNLGRLKRQEFLRSLSVLSVPTLRPEAFGLYVLEALASGVPVVEPRHGALVELLEATGGGILVEPGDLGALTAALQDLLLHPAKARDLGMRGRKAVLEQFAIERSAREMARLMEGAR